MKKLIIIVSFVAWSIFGPSETVSASMWIQLMEQSSTELYQGHNVGPFDQVAVFWQVNDKFTMPTFTGFTDSNWSNYNVSNTEAYAFGPSSTWLRFYLNFNNVTPPIETAFLYQVSLNGDVAQRQVLAYTQASHWIVSEFTGTDQQWHALGGQDPLVIPEPLSLVLLLTGCAGLVAMRLRRK